MHYQQTIREQIDIEGIGLHSGKRVNLSLKPAPANTGVIFRRTDLGVDIPALADFVVATQLATTLGRKDAQIGTVEHLMAALAGLQVDNLRIDVDAPEIPVLDGSASAFALLISEVGLEVQSAPARVLELTGGLEEHDADKRVLIAPASELRMDFAIDFEHPLLGDQRLELRLDPQTFADQIAPARTFGFKRDVDRLRSMGLALGGSLDNAVVIDEHRILNPRGLRFPDEFVRHKMLDCLGDLALCGVRLRGHISAERSGHELNNRLCRKMLGQVRRADHLSLAAMIG